MDSFAKDGFMNGSEFMAIANYKFMMNGKLVSIQEQWGDELAPIWKSIADRRNAEDEAKRNQFLAFDANLQTALIQAEKDFGRQLTEFDVKPLMDARKVQYPELSKQFSNPITAHVNRNSTQMAIKDERNYLLTKAKTQGLIAKDLATVHPQLAKEFEAQLIDPSGKFREKYIDALKYDFANKLEKAVVGGDIRNPQIEQMADRTIRTLYDNVLESVKLEKYKNASDAWQVEYSLIKKEIKDESNKAYQLEGTGKHAEFSVLSEDLKLDSKYAEEANDQGTAFLRSKRFSEKDILTLKQVTSGDSLPDFVHAIAAEYPNLNPLQVANEIRQSYGFEPINSVGIKILEYLDPKFHRSVNHKPSQKKLFDAMAQQTIESNQDVLPFEPFLNLIKGKEVMKVDPENEGYDAVFSTSNGRMTTSRDLTGIVLEEMTVDEVLDLMLSRKTFNEVGAFQIEAKELSYHVNRGAIPRKAKFDRETQNALAILNVWNQSGYFLVSDDENPSQHVIEGLGQSWAGINTDKQMKKLDKSGKKREGTIQALQTLKERLAKSGFNMTLFRREIDDVLLENLAAGI